MLWCRRKSHHNVWDNAELISSSLDWQVLLVLEQAQPDPVALQHWVHVAVWSYHHVLTSKSQSSHTKYFSHTEGTLPLSCQSRHPPTDIRESVAELGSLPKTSFLNGKNGCLLSQVTRYCNKLYSKNYRCCKWNVLLTPKTCILCLLKWGLN